MVKFFKNDPELTEWSAKLGEEKVEPTKLSSGRMQNILVRLEAFITHWEDIQQEAQSRTLNQSKVLNKVDKLLSDYQYLWRDSQYLINAPKSDDEKLEAMREKILTHEIYGKILDGSIVEKINQIASLLEVRVAPLQIEDDNGKYKKRS